jgi:cysteine-rich repeat protein
LLEGSAAAQIAVTSATTTLDFTGFTAAGIVPAPSAGQLSSLAWSVIGLSDGNLDFGGNGTAGDFSRGPSMGGVTTGGIYAFDTGGGNVSLGIQPSDADFTPGALIARFKNELTRPLLSVDVSYTIWVLADEAHSTSFDFSWSTDNVTFTSVPALDFTTDGPIPTTPDWRSYPQTTTVALNVPPNGFLFLRWTSDDAGGSGGRDEIALDDLTLHVNQACGDGYVEGSEACDDGNLDNTDGCLVGCVLPTCGDGYVEQGVEECDPKPGSGADPACCSLACLFTDGNACTGGGTCHSGECVPPVTSGAGGGTAAGAGGEAGEAGAGGESRGGTSGAAHGGSGPSHAGTGARPPKGFAGQSSATGGNGGRGSGGTSNGSGTGGSSSTHQSTGGSAGSGGTGGGGTSANAGEPATGGAPTGGAGSAGRAAAGGGKAGGHAAPAGAATSDSGCGCRVPAGAPANGVPIMSGLGLLALASLRRRARSS